MNLGVPPADIDLEVGFILDVLGYRRAARDPSLGDIGVYWFEADDGSQIHLSIDDDHRPAGKAHVALAYGADLAAVEDRLTRTGVDYKRSERSGFPAVVICRDPAGNMFELRGEAASARDDPTSHLSDGV